MRAWTVLDPLDPAPSVLLVAPDPEDRAALRALLESHRFRCLAPPLVRLARSRARHVDLVLVDLSRADRATLELCGELKRHHPSLQVVGLLPGASAGAMETVGEARLDDFLCRPFSDEELIVRLHARLRTRQAERSEAAGAAKHQVLVDIASAGLFVIKDGWFTYVNGEFARLFGYSAHEVSGVMTIHDLVEEEDRFSVGSRFQQWMETEVHTFQCAFRAVRKDGQVVHVEIRATRVELAGRRAYAGTVLDVSLLAQVQEAKRQQAEYFRALIERAQDTITVVDREGRVQYESPSIQSVLGYSPQDLLGRNVFDLVHRDDVPRTWAVFAHMLETPGAVASTRCRFRHAGGAWRVLEATARNLLDDPVVGGVVINARDVTEQQAAEDALRRAALADSLTGLPNRTLFADRLAQAQARTLRHPESRFAVLLLDLDRFKVVNDSLGHEMGDLLLVAIGRRLQMQVRPEDTVARFGGDEFAVLLEDVRGARDCTRVADRILDALSRPFELDGREVFTSASVGIVVHAHGDDSSENLLRNVDVAMYRAKAAGGGCCEIFDRGMHLEAVRRLQIETDLRRAVERDELRLHYQPIVELKTGRIAGFEALVRWRHPERGLIPPADFIGIAEETGQIEEIGRWVIEVAVGQVREWQRASASPDLWVAVNLSSRQLRNPEVVAHVRDTLRAAGIRGPSLKLEITESMVVDDTDRVADTLRQLKELDVQLYMDDFGTGYASLAYLHRLPLDGLKIDRSFVSPMHADARHAVLVERIVTLARALGLKIVAEGIELCEHRARLRELRCDFGQGYLFSRPLEPAGAAALLEGGLRASPAGGPARAEA